MLDGYLPDFHDFATDARGRFIRLRKGDNSAAIAEQKAGRLQSAEQFRIQMGLLAKQAALAAEVKTPTILPAAPPTQTNDGTIEAARDQQRNAARRFSISSTRIAGSNAPRLGQSTVLGGFRPA